MNLYYLEAQVHKKLDSGPYRVKVLILNEDIGMYINGNLVSPPNEEYPNWSVRTPRVYRSKAGIVEFDGKSPLWKEYKQACIEAVQEFMRHEQLDAGDDMGKYEGLNQDEFNKQFMDDVEKLGF